MRILILTNKPPYPPKDGGAIAVFNLAKGIADAGNSIHILAYNTSKHRVDTSTIPTFSNLKITHVDIDTSIKIGAAISNFLFSRQAFNSQRFISKFYIQILEDILKSESFDIVQLEGPYLWFCAPTIRKYSKAIISLRGHNIEHEIWYRTANAENNFVKKHYLRNLAKRIRRFEHAIINQYDVLLPITSRDGRVFTEMGNKKPMHVVPVGINTEGIPAHRYEQNNAIFYIGALDWTPNQEGLLWFIEHVWPNILKVNPTAILHIAGRNAPIWFSSRITASNVMYHGEVENAYTYMQQAGIMIVPLFSGSGMRVKIIEGMALGKAIVATDIGVEGIDVVEGKDILLANNAELFAHKILVLLDSKKLATEISENARKCVKEKYDNTVISSKLIEFYQLQLNKTR